MDTTITVLLSLLTIALVLGVLFMITIRFLSNTPTRQRPRGPTSENSDPLLNPPSQYTVRGNNRYLKNKTAKPRIIMWAIVGVGVYLGLLIVSPQASMDVMRTLGPACFLVVLGFFVRGYGYKMEEQYRSYEYSSLGWGGAIILWLLALYSLWSSF
jgi:hypothetical protein